MVLNCGLFALVFQKSADARGSEESEGDTIKVGKWWKVHFSPRKSPKKVFELQKKDLMTAFIRVNNTSQGPQKPIYKKGETMGTKKKWLLQNPCFPQIIFCETNPFLHFFRIEQMLVTLA